MSKEDIAFRKLSLLMKAVTEANEQDDSLEELKAAAFEVLRLNPGCEQSDWAKILVEQYGTEVVDAYGKDPAEHICIGYCEEIGISPQALNLTFNAADIKSGTLERIAEVLGVKMSFFYPKEREHQNAVASGNGIAFAGNNNVAGNVTMGDNSAVLQERVAMLEKFLEEKERTIQILMER